MDSLVNSCSISIISIKLQKQRTRRIIEKDASNLILKKKNPLLVNGQVTVAGLHACRRRHSENDPTCLEKICVVFLHFVFVKTLLLLLPGLG